MRDREALRGVWCGEKSVQAGQAVQSGYCVIRALWLCSWALLVGFGAISDVTHCGPLCKPSPTETTSTITYLFPGENNTHTNTGTYGRAIFINGTTGTLSPAGPWSDTGTAHLVSTLPERGAIWRDGGREREREWDNERMGGREREKEIMREWGRERGKRRETKMEGERWKDRSRRCNMEREWGGNGPDPPIIHLSVHTCNYACMH